MSSRDQELEGLSNVLPNGYKVEGSEAQGVARQQTQVAVAEQMHIPQSAVSRLENQSDCLLSTPRKYVGALRRDARDASCVSRWGGRARRAYADTGGARRSAGPMKMIEDGRHLRSK